MSVSALWKYECAVFVCVYDLFESVPFCVCVMAIYVEVTSLQTNGHKRVQSLCTDKSEN